MNRAENDAKGLELVRAIDFTKADDIVRTGDVKDTWGHRDFEYIVLFDKTMLTFEVTVDDDDNIVPDYCFFTKVGNDESFFFKLPLEVVHSLEEAYHSKYENATIDATAELERIAGKTAN